MSLDHDRDYFRKMSTAEHKPKCRAFATDKWGWRVRTHPDPDCPGCNSPADRALFGRLADEVDAYLNQPEAEDLFGEMSALPIEETP